MFVTASSASDKQEAEEMTLLFSQEMELEVPQTHPYKRTPLLTSFLFPRKHCTRNSQEMSFIFID